MVLFGALIWMNKVNEDKKLAKLHEEQEKEAVLKQKEAEDSFYQKLIDGFSVNIFIVDDSISENGQREKGRCTLLKNNLARTYSSRKRKCCAELWRPCKHS